MNQLLFKMVFKSKAYFDGEGNSPPPPPPPPPANNGGDPKFTAEQQEWINRKMADHKRSLQNENKELVKQLEDLRASSNLSQQQKEELDARIQTLTQSHLTKEQQQASEIDKLNKKLKADTESLTAEGNKWKSNFNSMLIKNEILAGATKHSAANAAQLHSILVGQAKVVEVIDETTGKPTSAYAVKLPMVVVDPKTKQPTTVEFDMVEAIGKMREDDQHANLFLTDGKPGYGGNNANKSGAGGTPDFSKMTPDQYREWRVKQGLAGKR